MSKLAVKYNNKLNQMPFRNFNVSELNFFFTICANIKESGTKKVTYSFDKLRDLSNYQFTGNKRFVKDLESTYDKLLDLKMKLESESKLIKFNLFSYFEVDKDKRVVEIAVNEYFEYILNDLNIGTFTRFPLIEYTNINSTYTKTIYTQLKQWKSTGKWSINIDHFRELLQIPNSYRMTNIDQQILNPALEDLKPFFVGLKIKKLDRNDKPSGKGKPVKKIVFTFQQQNDDIKKISNDKVAYGIHQNVYLTEEEIHDVVYKLKAKYLIDDVSKWKEKKKIDNNNNDYAMIEIFYGK